MVNSLKRATPLPAEFYKAGRGGRVSRVECAAGVAESGTDHDQQMVAQQMCILGQ